MDQSQIVELQQLLNKVGGLLVTDGKAGPATAQAIADARSAAGLPPGTQADDALLAWLRKQPEPSDVVPTDGVVAIARWEVTSRSNYDQNCAMPTWPGESSGITIGIGYDLRFQPDFDSCWKDLPAETLDALRPWVGKPGTQAAAAALSKIRIPFFAAWKAFTLVTLPKEVQTTQTAYGDLKKLPPLCRAALVSLVYNRGPDLGLKGDPQGRRTEMRAIRDLIQAGKLDQVPAQFLSMQRLWPNARGLRDRRAAEAQMWQQGLKQAQTEAVPVA